MENSHKALIADVSRHHTINCRRRLGGRSANVDSKGDGKGDSADKDFSKISADGSTPFKI